MNVTLLPSSGLPGEQFLTSFVINGQIALDAGSLGWSASLHDQNGIRHVLLSHSHSDHVASLPTFLENVFHNHPAGVAIYASQFVLDTLRSDLFNGRIWPDMLALPTADQPFVELVPLEAGKPFEIAAIRITPVSMDHAVPTLGFLFEAPGCSVAFASDTGPTHEIWTRANALANLRAVFLEVAFPNSHSELARISRHLTPALFRDEVEKILSAPRIIAVHLKPRFREEILHELSELALPNVEVIVPGYTYQF